MLQPRQYSISCAPNGKYYRISVKKEISTNHPDGMISNRLHDYIQEGEIIDLSAPAGVFVLKENSNTKVFISGGIGQTPLLSMLEALISKDNVSTNLVWIHGCRNEQVHAFKDRLTEINKQQINVKQFLFYDEVEEEESHIQQGWVDLSNLAHDVLELEADYYICGPAGFIQKHHDYLIERGGANSHIHFEEFGPASLQLS
ncbi:hypothetical protein [Sphingobacterium sp. 1.A.5]|uniref:hypothetical protein n=1 Tax=Sphingobacterium sp. 1.A.5 TaxID=2044604 RepID=UPI00211F1CA4|nr:hypothetical protein [Sphingobacterium sp. 1.A.5]